MSDGISSISSRHLCWLQSNHQSNITSHKMYSLLYQVAYITLPNIVTDFSCKLFHWLFPVRHIHIIHFFSFKMKFLKSTSNVLLHKDIVINCLWSRRVTYHINTQSLQRSRLCEIFSKSSYNITEVGKVPTIFKMTDRLFVNVF